MDDITRDDPELSHDIQPGYDALRHVPLVVIVHILWEARLARDPFMSA